MQFIVATRLKNCSACRAGVIPYCIRDDKIYFLMGIDDGTSEYSDFGGASKQGETALQTALRELKEETGGLVSIEETDEVLKLSVAMLSDAMSRPGLQNPERTTPRYKMVCIFMPVSLDTWNLPTAFCVIKTVLNGGEYNEMKAISWIDEAQFAILIGRDMRVPGGMWERLTRFYRPAFSHESTYTLLKAAHAMANRLTTVG